MKRRNLISQDFSGQAWRRLLLAAFVCMLAAFAGHTVHAQQGVAGDALTLRPDQERYSLGPYIHTTVNPGQKLNFDSYSAMVERHLAGNRGDTIEGNILNMGAGSEPHWMIFSVMNRSWTDRWVLSFGQHMDGRLGLIKDIFVYDNNTKFTYINTLSSSKNPYVKTEALEGTSLSLTIPTGKETLIFMYVVPEAGMPVTIAPELMTEAAFIEKLTSPVSQDNLLTYYILLVCGFFLATILYRQIWGSVLFIAYYMIQIALLQHQNAFLQMDLPMVTHIPGIIFNAGVIMGLLMTKSFLNIGKLQMFQSRLVYGFILILLAATLSAVFLIADDAMLQIPVMYGPALCTMLFMFLLSLAAAYTGESAGYPVGFSWLFVLAAACISAVSLMNVFVPMAVAINAYWYGIIIQSVLLVGASVSRLLTEEREREFAIAERQREQQSVSSIMQSKESSENSRLLRMIEHEREVMNELRAREAEQREEMRKAKEEAVLANNAKSAFLAVISHEIRTPMTGIMGMVRFLLETNLDKQQKGYAQTLQDSGEAMLSLLNDILDFEKIESGKMELERIDFDLQRLINGIRTLMAGHAETKNIYLKLNVDPGVPHYVIGDPVRLRQVILNLVGNSIKFTGKGGVTLEVKPEKAGPGTGKKNVHRIRFSVIDTGVGISREAQKSLFNPFSQADTSVARKFGGTGLGLAISQKLIEAMGGHIEINSTEGHGSTFYFTIVMEEGSAEAVEKAEAASRTGTDGPQKAMKVLIVEDNEISQKLMKELVDRMGHATWVAGSGEEALKVVESNEIDLILMDIQLPGMSGMGTTKALRALADRKRAAIPVIALTGNVMDEDIKQCYAANMNGHLAKPIDPKKLKEQIAKVADNRMDNPVQLPEERRDEHAGMRRLNIGNDKFGPGAAGSLQTEEEETTTDSAAEFVPGDDNKDVERDERSRGRGAPHPAKEKDPAPAGNWGRDEVAPITALAKGGSIPVLDSQEGDLDEEDHDSFEAAIAKESAPLSLAPVSVLDEAIINNLRRSMKPDKLDSLYSEMFEKADDIVQRLQDAESREQWPVVGERAHELKGMAGNFGFSELSIVAAQIEKAVRTGRGADEIKTHAARIPDALGRARQALEAMKAA